MQLDLCIISRSLTSEEYTFRSIVAIALSLNEAIAHSGILDIFTKQQSLRFRVLLLRICGLLAIFGIAIEWFFNRFLNFRFSDIGYLVSHLRGQVIKNVVENSSKKVSN